MRWMRAAVLASLAFKAIVLGAWWWGSVARAERAGAAEPAGEGKSEAAVPDDLLARSRGFRDLLEAVKQRGQELDQREQELASRTATLEALQKAITEQAARAVPAPAPSTGPTPSGGEPPRPAASGASVVKVYENMKAEEAAPILDRLDDATARSILVRMKERQVAAILGAMNRDRAVALTKALAAGQQ